VDVLVIAMARRDRRELAPEVGGLAEAGPEWAFT
jgi:hypothetical protein